MVTDFLFYASPRFPLIISKLHGPAGKPENPVGGPKLVIEDMALPNRKDLLSQFVDQIWLKHLHHLYAWFPWRQIYTIVRLQSSGDVD